jgi:hypothetical protein
MLIFDFDTLFLFINFSIFIMLALLVTVHFIEMRSILKSNLIKNEYYSSKNKKKWKDIEL